MTWKMRGRLLGVALLCAAFVSANAGGGVAAARNGEAPRAGFNASRIDMTVAQAQAHRHLDRFFDAVVGADGVARNGAAIRIALKAENGRTEEVWVTPFAKRDGILMGALADTPRHAKGRKAGDLISFQRADVRDWSFYGPDGRIYGNFATRLMLTAIAPDQAADIAALLSETPAPAGW